MIESEVLRVLAMRCAGRIFLGSWLHHFVGRQVVLSRDWLNHLAQQLNSPASQAAKPLANRLRNASSLSPEKKISPPAHPGRRPPQATNMPQNGPKTHPHQKLNPPAPQVAYISKTIQTCSHSNGWASFMETTYFLFSENGLFVVTPPEEIKAISDHLMVIPPEVN